MLAELKIKLSVADRTTIKMIFSFSVFSFLLHVSSSLIYATDNVVVGAFLPVTAVTFYVIAGNLIEYTRVLLSGVTQTMTPLASSIEAKYDLARLQNVLLLGSRAAEMIVLPIALTFMLRGHSFVGLWMGTQYADISGMVLWILSWTLLVWPATSVTSSILLGMSKHRPLVPVAFAEGLCNLALSIVWARGSLGVLGVAWGTMLPSIAVSLLFWPWHVHRTLHIRPITYITCVWIRPGAAILPFALATYAIELHLPATNLVAFFLQIAMTLPLALIGYWLVCLNQTQRADYSKRMSQTLQNLCRQ